MLVPVNGAAAPAPVMSMKSQLDKDTAAALTVAGSPGVSAIEPAQEPTSTRFVALLPFTVKVPVTVTVDAFPRSMSVSVLFAVPVTVRFAIVHPRLMR
jgi:hypothetical protein